jgi:DNA-binding NarL/FixJ family response regulator
LYQKRKAIFVLEDVDMIKLAIVDDNESIRDSLKQVFQLFDEIEVVWTATDGEEAVHIIEDDHPADVILMDIEMRKMDGITATDRIKTFNPAIKIVMLTIFEDESNLVNALRAGADGYLLKGEKPLKMIGLIKDAMEDRFPLSPEMAKKAMQIFRDHENAQKTDLGQYGLTKREKEVLDFLVSGKTYKQIADEMIVSPFTIRSHMENLYRKLDVHNKAEAVALAMRNGWS